MLRGLLLTNCQPPLNFSEYLHALVHVLHHSLLLSPRIVTVSVKVHLARLFLFLCCLFYLFIDTKICTKIKITIPEMIVYSASISYTFNTYYPSHFFLNLTSLHMNDMEFKQWSFWTAANAFHILFRNKSMQMLKGFRFHLFFETSSPGASTEQYRSVIDTNTAERGIAGIDH